MTMAPIYMDAELSPSRSLSARGFRLMMMILAGFGVIMGLYFLSFGFLPIVGFLGLDLILLWLVFRRSFRDQRQRTYVKVTAQNIEMRHIDGKGRETSAQLPASFARVELDMTGSRPGAIKVAASGKAYLIGRFLTLQERRDFITCMRNALHQARAERYVAE